jgi:signal transduction histidine kinase
MGKILLKEKQFTLAETYFKKCSAYFLQSQEPTEKRGYYAVLHQLFFETGRYKEAYQYFQNYSELNDTILNSERSKQFSDREAKYQSEKKDAQIEWQRKSLKQRKMLNSLLAGSALALLIISLLTYRNYKHKQRLHQQRINELETEKQLTATEAVLKGEEQERTRLAKDLHDGLGGMLSGIKYSFSTMKGNLVMTPENALAFERSMDILDSSIKEMRRLAHNMMPEALVKFGLDIALKDFCNDISTNSPLKVNYQSLGLEKKEIEQTTAITIYRIVQELINNLQFSKGIGWSNIQSRLNFLKGKFDIQSEKNKGTSVHIEVVVE